MRQKIFIFVVSLAVAFSFSTKNSVACICYILSCSDLGRSRCSSCNNNCNKGDAGNPSLLTRFKKVRYNKFVNFGYL